MDVGADFERALVFSYWAEIKRLPIDKCKAQCEDLRAEARRMIELERRASLYLLEGRRLDASVDYPRWAKMPYWTVDETTALILARDPDWVDWAAVEPHVKICTFAERFRVIRLLITRAQQVGYLEREMRPVDVMDWAKQNTIELPPELVRAIAASPVQVSLRAENEALKKRVAQLQSELHPKRKTSHFKVAYCCAKKFGYRRGQRTSWASQLSTYSRTVGCLIDEGTLRDIINEVDEAGVIREAEERGAAES